MQFKGLTLDPFQEEAIRAVDANHSVIVAAPTGAGKTVIAEYAIEKAIKNDRQIIYTAPIKALSNQKYRDFSRDYPDKIGIMTGDVILNPEAPILIMTTEIFRNIIFDAGASRLKEIESVIFDEIHYINDIQRGTVWEESIIFAPQHITFICLSATIPNFDEFADWMRSVRDKPIQSVVEKHRPVPLKIHIWIPGFGFRDINFIKKLEKEKNKYKRSRRATNVDLVYHLRREKQLPCLYFHFSRIGCEEYAQHFRGINLLDHDERRQVLSIYDELCKQFGVSLRGQANLMRNLLKSGVAFHHAGVLPSLKEILERLYTMGLIKLLFTTETFAVGINMPARAVIFNNIMKNDGISFRYLTAREFQQMSGRAGRRGIDDVGYAYACIQPRDANYKGVRQCMSKDAEDIQSQFSLSYSSILNLYDTFGDAVYEVCEMSFNNFKTIAQVKGIRKHAAGVSKQIDRLKHFDCLHGDFSAHFMPYMEIRDRFLKLEKKIKMRKKKNKPPRFEDIERLKQIKHELENTACMACKKRKVCLGIHKKIKRHELQLKDYNDEIYEVENSQKSILERRVNFLKKLGYVDDKGLLPRGRIASQIFGYEIVFTELYFDGIFEVLDERAMNVLVCSIVFESRRGAKYRKLNDQVIAAKLRRAEDTVSWLMRKEMEEDVPGLIKPLDPKLNKAVYEWSSGCSFEDLKKFTSGDEGDLVRSFRLIVDFLRQLKRAINEPIFRTKVDKCVALMYRDVVDAEAQLKTDLKTEDRQESTHEENRIRELSAGEAKKSENR